MTLCSVCSTGGQETPHLSQVFRTSPQVFGGGGLEVVAGRASQQARRKRLPSVLTEAGMLQVGAEDAAFERRQDGAAGRSADIYLEVRQVPRTQVVLTAGCLRLPSDMFRANPSRLTLSPEGPSE